MTPADKAFCDMVLQVALCNPAMVYNTFDLAERALEVPGDFAEAGVFAGAHPAVMAGVLQKHGVTDRRVHLFDSFEGIPKPQAHEDPNDIKVMGAGTPGVLESSGRAVCSLEGVKGYMHQWGIDPALLVYHPGWFQETLPSFTGIRNLALLRVDCDLYDSTRCVFESLYPRVTAGGYVIDDDLGSPTCRRAVKDVLGTLPEMTHVDVGTHWWRRT